MRFPRGAHSAGYSHPSSFDNRVTRLGPLGIAAETGGKDAAAARIKSGRNQAALRIGAVTVRPEQGLALGRDAAQALAFGVAPQVWQKARPASEPYYLARFSWHRVRQDPRCESSSRLDGAGGARSIEDHHRARRSASRALILAGTSEQTQHRGVHKPTDAEGVNRLQFPPQTRLAAD